MISIWWLVNEVRDLRCLAAMGEADDEDVDDAAEEDEEEDEDDDDDDEEEADERNGEQAGALAELQATWMLQATWI